MKSLQELNDLVNSEESENIELALMLCESQDIIFEGLDSVQKYVPIIRWLNTHLDGYNDIKEGLVNAINLSCLNLCNAKIDSLPESIGL